MLEGRCTTFPLAVTSEWKCRWPRPHTLASDVTCEVTISGERMDITGLKQVTSQTAKTWLKLSGPFIEERDDRTLLNNFPAIPKIMGKSICFPFVGQLLYHFGMHIERVVGGSLKGAVTENNQFLTNAEWTTDGVCVQGDDADMYVAKYVHASCHEIQSKTEYCITTDKGIVNKLPLQDTLIGAANKVVMCCLM